MQEQVGVGEDAAREDELNDQIQDDQKDANDWKQAFSARKEI